MIKKKYIKLFLLLPLLSSFKIFAAESIGPVDHSYQDHLSDPIDHAQEDRNSLSQFPEKLYKLLSDAEEDDFEQVVSWMPHGRSFKVHESGNFLEIVKTYFKQTKLSSFQRQLALYGFKRITKGPDSGSYYHEMFLQGRLDLAKKIKRSKLKGHNKLKSNPENEPDFYKMIWCRTATTAQVKAIEPVKYTSNSEQPCKDEDEDSGLDFFVNMIEDGDSDNYDIENTDCSSRIEEQDDEYFGLDFFDLFSS